MCKKSIQLPLESESIDVINYTMFGKDDSNYIYQAPLAACLERDYTRNPLNILKPELNSFIRSFGKELTNNMLGYYEAGTPEALDTEISFTIDRRDMAQLLRFLNESVPLFTLNEGTTPPSLHTFYLAYCNWLTTQPDNYILEKCRFNKLLVMAGFEKILIRSKYQYQYQAAQHWKPFKFSKPETV